MGHALHKTGEELTNYVKETLEKRNKFYKKAHIIADARDLEINKLIEIIKKKSVG